MAKLKPHYKKWADLVISGINPIEAALKVWPTITTKTARNKSGVIGQKEEVARYIKEHSDKIHAKASEKVIEELSDQMASNILTSARKREILAQIASGELEQERFVMVKGELKKVKSKPTLAERMHAIDLDNKMSGDHVLAKPNQTAKVEEVKRVIIKEDQSEPIKKVKK